MTTTTTPAASPAKRAAISLVLTVAVTLAAAVILGEGAYLWIKAAHVIAIISWMAGMLYLPRLFIYHCDAEKGSVQSETFKVMERRLLTIILNPAMVIAWGLGLWLAWIGQFYSSPWFIANEDRNDKSPRHWRIVNEIPTVLMIGIVILVIVKPF